MDKKDIFREEKNLVTAAMSYQRVFGPSQIHTYSTAAPFRFGPKLWSLRKGLNTENAVFYISMTPQISTSNNKGTRINSFDVVYSVSGANLTAAPTDSAAIVNYTNAASPTLTSQTLTGGPYPTAVNTAGQVYVLRRTVSAPDFMNDPISTYNIELTFPCDAATILDILAVNINFSWVN